jgi:hypothetical protein
MSALPRLPFAFAALLALALAAPTRAQLQWSLYDETTVTSVTSTADRVSVTVAPGQRVTLFATNFVPLDLAAATAAPAAVSVTFTASGGLSTLASGTRAIGFGLFNSAGTAAAFTDDPGYFTWINGRATGSLLELRRRNATGPSPSLLAPTGASFANLGTGSAVQTAGALVDGVPYTLTLRLVRSAAGLSLGTGTGTDTAGVWLRGDGLSQTAYTNPDTSPAATTFNELGFMFQNTTAAPVTLTLTDVAGLTPLAAPVITSQPTQLILNPGQTGTLAVTATGTPPLTYQWRRDAVPLAGAEGASLAVTSAGAYSVIVSNAYGSAISSAATVIVSSNPVPATIETQPTSVTVAVGQPAAFSVTAFGSAPLTYEWQKNSIAIAGASANSLAFGAVTAADAGVYSVVVRNTVSAVVSNPVTLVVNTPPTIVTQPAGTHAALGSAVRLAVAATAPTGTLAYQWSRNGAPLAGATAATLSFPSLASSELGTYTVRVSNAFGSVLSSAAVVTAPSSMRVVTRSPAAGAVSVLPDQPLRLTFDRPVRAGTSGRIRIINTSTNAVVDTLDLGAAPTRLVGTNPTPYAFYPAIATDRTVAFYPRAGVLAYGQTYRVVVETGVVLDPDGTTFGGVADTDGWTFTVRNAGPLPGTRNLVVAADGSGDFASVQGAVDFVPAGNTAPVTIAIKPGTYHELVFIGSNKPFLTLRGEARDAVVIAYPNNNNFNAGNNRAMVACDASDVRFETLTLRNTTPKGGSQAEALRGNGQRVVLDRVALSSFQDTLLWNGSLFVADSFIEGDVDFMWGGGAVYFHRCELKALSSGAYYAQVRNSAATKGHVYVDCRLTAADGVTGAYLARIDPREGVANTWPASQVVFIDCAMGPHLAREGWRLDNATTAPSLQFWEYRSVDLAGASLDVTGRLRDSRQIAESVAAQYRNPQFVVGFTPALAPTVATPPAGQAVTAGANVRLSVVATGYPAPNYQWLRGGQPIAGATAATLVLARATTADSGDYTVRVSNLSGSVTSAPAAVVVAPGRFTGQYFGTVQPAGAFALHVRDDHSAVLLLTGLSPTGATAVRTVKFDDTGRAAVAVANLNLALAVTDAGVLSGTVTGNSAAVLNGQRFSGGPFAAFAGHFLAGSAAEAAAVDVIADGSGRVFAVTADGRGGSGSLSSTGAFSAGPVAGTLAADGSTVAINALAGSPVALTGAADRLAPGLRLTGLSTRAQAGSGGNAAIVGFVVSGDAPKPVLVRAVGPALAAFGVGGTLPAPKVELFRGQSVIAANTGWSTSPVAGAVAAASAQVGLFPLAANSADSALLLTLAPGAYTAVMTDAQGRTGNGLVEIYDLAAADGPHRLANLSSRAFVGSGDATLIAGMTVAGPAAKRVLLRAAGPALAALGVGEALARAELTLLQGSRIVARNTGWSAGGDTAAISAAAAQVGAFPFAAGSADAALLLTLPPGNYTAQITGAAGTTGVALVEVYEL